MKTVDDDGDGLDVRAVDVEELALPDQLVEERRAPRGEEDGVEKWKGHPNADRGRAVESMGARNSVWPIRSFHFAGEVTILVTGRGQ